MGPTRSPIPCRVLPVRAAVLAVLLLGACSRPTAVAQTPIPGGGRGAVATVTRVIDGDTVELTIGGHAGETVRLLGIDTPETVKPNAPVDCFGPEASARTKELLPAGTEVVVQRDVEARDRFGRLLLYVWRRSDGLFVNGSLLRDGYARVLSIEPNGTRRSELAAAAGEASRGRLGLWGTCPPRAS